MERSDLYTPREAKRRLLLHVGPHKTGTTAIQRAMVENRDILAVNGAVYPNIGFSYFGQHKIAESLEVRYRRDEFLSYMEEIRRIDSRLIILSSENFSRCSPEALRLLAEQLSDFDVNVVYYLRSFVEIPYSWWQEQVKHKYTFDFTTFMTNTLLYPYRNHILNVTNVVSAFVEAFGRSAVDLYIYNDIMRERGGDVSSQFVESILGMTGFRDVSGVKSTNKALGPLDAELVRMLNRSGKFGIELLRNENAQNLKRALAEEVKPFLQEVVFSYKGTSFLRLEKELIHHWSDLVRGGERFLGSGELFAEREKTIQYVDPQIWIFNENLGRALRELILASAAAQ